MHYIYVQAKSIRINPQTANTRKRAPKLLKQVGIYAKHRKVFLEIVS